MGNDYFQFKRFTVRQSRAAMKVCTDACVFGAYVAQNISAARVLDIGAGTGLLSLMYAQKHPDAHIDAIEIEPNAYLQAKENLEQSPWAENIQVHHCALQQYENTTVQYQYGLILSNPPFFDKDLRSGDAARNTAMHSTQLSLSEIFQFSSNHLVADGRLALLLPFHRHEDAQNIALQNGFFLEDALLVRQSPRHGFFRSILFFSKQGQPVRTSEMAIRNIENQYDAAFAALLRDYYLFLE
ncbi:MAG: methyltransferase [Chitinophagaceae bacterium]